MAFSAAGLLCCGTIAQDFTATITSDQALPPSGSQMAGHAQFTLSNEGLFWSHVWVDFAQDTDTVTIFRSSSRSDLGVSLFSVPLVGGYGPGLTSPPGYIFDGPVTFNASQIADLYAGNLWINVETPDFPNGEIRGQIVAVPEPSPTALFAIAALGFICLSRRVNAHSSGAYGKSASKKA
jgi:hypothetical protein